MIRFTEDHEWLSLDGDVALVGITPYAQEQLGDLVFVELPEVGASFSKGAVAAVVESVKAASEIYAPLDGEIVEVNPDIVNEPALINKDPMGKGWFFKLKLKNPDQAAALKSEDEYKALTGAAG